ncbi:MAG: hypothetical protein R3C52_01410 [Hyphomonadaceae bacterium]
MIASVFTVENPLTLRLALFIGLFLLAASSLLVRTEHARTLLTSLKSSPAALHATGAVTGFAGGGLLVAHVDFSSPLAALVTLVALWWAIEGLAILAIGHLLDFASEANIRIYAMSNVIALALGLFLVAGGLLGSSSAGGLMAG